MSGRPKRGAAPQLKQQTLSSAFTRAATAQAKSPAKPTKAICSTPASAAGVPGRVETGIFDTLYKEFHKTTPLASASASRSPDRPGAPPPKRVRRATSLPDAADFQLSHDSQDGSPSGRAPQPKRINELAGHKVVDRISHHLCEGTQISVKLQEVLLHMVLMVDVLETDLAQRALSLLQQNVLRHPPVTVSQGESGIPVLRENKELWMCSCEHKALTEYHQHLWRGASNELDLLCLLSRHALALVAPEGAGDRPHGVYSSGGYMLLMRYLVDVYETDLEVRLAAAARLGGADDDEGARRQAAAVITASHTFNTLNDLRLWTSKGSNSKHEMVTNLIMTAVHSGAAAERAAAALQGGAGLPPPPGGGGGPAVAATAVSAADGGSPAVAATTESAADGGGPAVAATTESAADVGGPAVAATTESAADVGDGVGGPAVAATTVNAADEHSGVAAAGALQGGAGLPPAGGGGPAVATAVSAADVGRLASRLLSCIVRCCTAAEQAGVYTAPNGFSRNDRHAVDQLLLDMLPVGRSTQSSLLLDWSSQQRLIAALPLDARLRLLAMYLAHTGDKRSVREPLSAGLAMVHEYHINKGMGAPFPQICLLEVLQYLNSNIEWAKKNLLGGRGNFAMFVMAFTTAGAQCGGGASNTSAVREAYQSLRAHIAGDEDGWFPARDAAAAGSGGGGEVGRSGWDMDASQCLQARLAMRLADRLVAAL